MSEPTDEQKAAARRLAETLVALDKKKKYSKLDFFKPYPKQIEFFNMGATLRERLLMAANRVGKTEAGAAEMAFHLTGLYPKWWKGRRFTKEINAWAAGVTVQVVRETLQSKLLGPPGIVDMQGTGYIPKSKIIKVSSSRGIAESVDTVQVQHVSGGISTLGFKSYDQGREKFQGATLDLVWLDEEPDMPVYSEALTRISATGGSLYMTFTPAKGPTEVVNLYITDKSPDRGVIGMTIEDAEHIPASERQKIIDGYLPQERDARAKGIPYLGSGLIFRTPEGEISETPFEIPEYWPLLWAIDFGIGHPFAAVLLAWDRDADVVHIAHGIRMKDARILDHCQAIKAWGQKWGEKIPVAWPQDGTIRREFEGDLTPTAAIYRANGLRMQGGHAKFADGTNSTEAGLALMTERLATKKLRVFNTCPEWFEEYRMYHRKEGKIVKMRDDLLSATRIGIMTLRTAQPVKLQARIRGQNSGGNFSPPVDLW